MSIINDTIRDARRPIAGNGMQYSTDTHASIPEIADIGPEAMLMEVSSKSFPQDSMTSGMHSESRFRKEGQYMPREAPFQSGGGEIRLPAGDPLLARTKVERPKSLATNVGITDISVKGDNQESELETGQEEHGSPGKVAAANVKSESNTHQSAVLSEPIEAESYHETHQSKTREGSERLVSRQGETYLRQSAGRGAPSEPPPEIARPATGEPRGSTTPLRAIPGAGIDPESAPAVPRRIETRQGATRVGANTSRPAIPSNQALALEVAATEQESPRENRASSGALPLRPDRLTMAVSARLPEPEQPSLVIGRIDVVVVANNEPVQSKPPALQDRGFLSRNYLKRL